VITIQIISIRKLLERREKNIIFNLEKEGEQIDKEEEMIKHATEYYKNLFGPSDSPGFNLDPEYWEQHEKVNDEENEALTRPFSEEEIKKLVMTMKRNSATGPDHIPIEFYSACWDFIKEDMMELLQDFWEHQTGY
jgi:hypothetical protein